MDEEHNGDDSVFFFFCPHPSNYIGIFYFFICTPSLMEGLGNLRGRGEVF